MKKVKRYLTFVMTAVMLTAVITSCHDDKKKDEPEKPEVVETIDQALLGSWQSKLILGEKSSEMTVTFKSDNTMSLTEKAVLSTEQEPIDITASGEYTATKGILTIKLTESSNPQLVGMVYRGKYEILVGQLYFQDLFLFPFDKID